MKAVLTVDPGIFTMGVCLWHRGRFFDVNPCFPDVSIDDVVKDKLRHEQVSQFQAMQNNITRLRKLFSTNEITDCYCEKPQMWQSARGFASAVQGHIQLIEMFRGMLVGLCSEYKTEWHDVKVVDWKGNLPKEIVIDRIKDFYRKHDAGIKLLSMSLDGNDWDALGIGLYLQGFFH